MSELRPCQLAPRGCDPRTCGVAFGCWWCWSVHPVIFFAALKANYQEIILSPALQPNSRFQASRIPFWFLGQESLRLKPNSHCCWELDSKSIRTSPKSLEFSMCVHFFSVIFFGSRSLFSVSLHQIQNSRDLRWMRWKRSPGLGHAASPGSIGQLVMGQAPAPGRSLGSLGGSLHPEKAVKDRRTTPSICNKCR